MFLNREKYQQLATLLERLYFYTTESPVQTVELGRGLLSLRQLFHEQILPARDDSHQVQSYHTEISKELRLLELELMFLQGAKQLSTAQRRLDSISQRLTTLINLVKYCEELSRDSAT